MRRAASSRHVAQSFSSSKHNITRITRIRVIVIDDQSSRSNNRRSLRERGRILKGRDRWDGDFSRNSNIRRKQSWNDDCTHDGESILGKRNNLATNKIFTSRSQNIKRILGNQFFYSTFLFQTVSLKEYNQRKRSIERSTLKILLWREIRTSTRFTNPLVCKEVYHPLCECHFPVNFIIMLLTIS